MRCQNCGSEIGANNKFCPKCGIPATRGNGYPYAQPAPQYEKPKSYAVLIIAIVLVLVLSIAIILGIFFIPRNTNLLKDTSTATTVTDNNTNETDNYLVVDIEATADPTVIPTATPTIRPTDAYVVDTSIAERNAKKEEFLRKAEAIEEYSRLYFETAMTQTDLNIESGNVYTKWDNLLNEVYQYLKQTMSASEFARLKEDEVAWITEKENAIEVTAAEYEGGSMAPMACNCTGIDYTEERCYYLISLIQ